jgi:hypothetical protein
MCLCASASQPSDARHSTASDRQDVSATEASIQTTHIYGCLAPGGDHDSIRFAAGPELVDTDLAHCIMFPPVDICLREHPGALQVVKGSHIFSRTSA